MFNRVKVATSVDPVWNILKIYEGFDSSSMSILINLIIVKDQKSSSFILSKCFTFSIL